MTELSFVSASSQLSFASTCDTPVTSSADSFFSDRCLISASVSFTDSQCALALLDLANSAAFRDDGNYFCDYSYSGRHVEADKSPWWRRFGGDNLTMDGIEIGQTGYSRIVESEEHVNHLNNDKLSGLLLTDNAIKCEETTIVTRGQKDFDVDTRLSEQNSYVLYSSAVRFNETIAFYRRLSEQIRIEHSYCSGGGKSRTDLSSSPVKRSFPKSSRCKRDEENSKESRENDVLPLKSLLSSSLRDLNSSKCKAGQVSGKQHRGRVPVHRGKARTLRERMRDCDTWLKRSATSDSTEVGENARPELKPNIEVEPISDGYVTEKRLPISHSHHQIVHGIRPNDAQAVMKNTTHRRAAVDVPLNTAALQYRGTTLYSCVSCPKAFNKKLYLIRHVRRMHPVSAVVKVSDDDLQLQLMSPTGRSEASLPEQVSDKNIES